MQDAMTRGQRLVLLAKGLEGEPRAAWFEAAHAGDLVLAAGQGGQRLVEVGAAALRALDADLPVGQMMAPGQPGALPVVRRATFDALIALPPVTAAPRQVAGASAADTPAGLAPKQVIRTGKRSIKVGTIVLASVAADDGWWEAEVIAIAAITASRQARATASAAVSPP